MTDKIDKELRKFSKKEQAWVKIILEKIKNDDVSDLDLKRLKGRSDIFRVRKGSIRILYKKDHAAIDLLAIERRNEGTYNNL